MEQIPDHVRFAKAAHAHHHGLDYDDAEMTTHVHHIADELLLMAAFNGYDALRSARATYPQFVDRALVYLKLQQEQTEKEAAKQQVLFLELRQLLLTIAESLEPPDPAIVYAQRSTSKDNNDVGNTGHGTTS